MERHWKWLKYRGKEGEKKACFRYEWKGKLNWERIPYLIESRFSKVTQFLTLDRERLIRICTDPVRVGMHEHP